MKRLTAVALTALPLFITAFPQTLPSDSLPGKPVAEPTDTLTAGKSLHSDEKNSFFDGVIPPSPQAAALARYAEYPVSHTTGVPDITVPLYEIDLGGFKLPITISYHASGARVDEIPTSVGLGWVLNAGGAVTRTILGAPDFYRKSASGSDYSLRNYDNISLAIRDFIDNGGSYDIIYGLTGNNPEYDSESDRFSFNAGGHTGVFRYSHNDNEFVVLNHDNCFISQNSYDESSSFFISFTDGTTYRFSATERTGVDVNGENMPYVTAWYVTSIETPWGNIAFKYRDGERLSLIRNSKVLTAGPMYEDDGFGNPERKIKTEVSESVSYPKTGQTLLESIEWNGNVITFSYEKTHPGTETDRLAEMRVVSSSGELVKKISFGNTGNWEDDPSHTNPQSVGRRMLESLHDSREGIYVFSYNLNKHMPAYNHINPALFSDLWGFYRGGESSTPFTKGINDRLVALLSEPDFKNIAYSSREPSLEAAKAGILEKITFPTGGSVSFNYELNSFGGQNTGGLRVSSVTVDSGDRTTTKRYSYSGTTTQENPEDLMVFDTYRAVYGITWSATLDRLVKAVDSPLFSSVQPGNYVSYMHVDEILDDGSKISFYYDGYELSELHGIKEGRHPSTFDGAVIDTGSRLPLLTEKSVYAPDGRKLFTEVTTYEKKNYIREFDTGVRTASEFLDYHIDGKPGGNPTLPYEAYDGPFQYVRSIARVRSALPVKKETTDHVTGFSTVTEYTYDGELRTRQPRSEIVTGSDGKVYRKEYEYAFDRVDDAECVRMTEYGFTDWPVEVRSYADGKLISSAKTEYALFNEYYYMPVVRKDWSCPTGDYSSSGKLPNPQPMVRERVSGYNSLGRPLSITVEDTDLTTFTWNTAGDLLLSSRAPGGMTTTYTHRPLFGVASVTQPNGHRSDFTYNDAGMLSSVADNLGVTERYGYSIANHSTPSMTGCGNSVTTTRLLDASGNTSVMSRQYHDGLGRPSVLVAGGANTSGRYLYSAVEYDSRGRESLTTLPMAGGTSVEEKTASAVREMSSDTYGDAYAWSETVYDGLDRPTTVSTPGKAWHDAGKVKRTEYVSNSANSVRYYHAPMNAITLSENGYYAAGTLQGVRSEDEEGNEMTVYSDRLGRKVLERRGPESLKGQNDTYFVYNDLGQLRYVLSPGYELSGYKDKFAYEYRYDERGNVVKKFIPGAGYTQYWYDRAGRMYLAEDLNLREKSLMRFTLYDVAGRPALQGVSKVVNRNSEVNRATYCGTPTGGFAWSGYNITYPHRLEGVTLESVSYYDDYSFVAGLDSRLASTVSHASAKGLRTGGVEYASDGGKSISAIYYDIRGNVIETREITASGTLRVTAGSYNFTNQPVSSTMTENGVTLKTDFGYDSASGLPVTTDFAVNGIGHEVSKVTYDDLGRVEGVRRGGEAARGGNLAYCYNLHGQTVYVSGPGFTQWLYYADGPGTPRYDGKVSAMSWTMGSDPALRGYRYSYNGYGWLTAAAYGEGDGLTFNRNRYTEQAGEFTRNGMPCKIQRYGLKADGQYGKIDNLRMTHDGNRITGVKEDADAVTTPGSMDFTGTKGQYMAMEYNSFGSLVRDESRGITDISYDSFGNPVKITYFNGNTTENTYTASGLKLKSAHTTGMASAVVSDTGLSPFDLSADAFAGTETIEYRGPVIYRNGKVEMILFNGGYCTIDILGGVTFHYYTPDCLGNNRAVINGTTSELEQTVAYYPYGVVIADLGSGHGFQPYKYGGKELMAANGLNEYDFGARQYWHAVPGFNRIDPLCEKYYWLSPYLYCGNDPVNAIDPDGKEWRPVFNSLGYVVQYEWVKRSEAIDDKGNLLPYHYEQAIYFTCTGTKGDFDPERKYNIGTSTAIVYKKDGTTENFDACTYPSDIKSYPTIPDGIYEAKVGKHKGQYDALRVSDIGTENFYANSIELGKPNPAHPNTTKARGINIHKPGAENKTGLTNNNKAISQGCLLIDRNKWDDFIKIFTTPDQINNTIGISIERY